MSARPFSSGSVKMVPTPIGQVPLIGRIAVTGAPKKKGGAPVSARPQSQDVTMLKVAERPDEGKTDNYSAMKFHTVSDIRKAAIWLDGQIAKAGGRPVGQLVELGPDLAAVLLERNPNNRRLRQAKVTEFRKDIDVGNWKLNGEPIIVSSDGMLNDGQHRCAAVIESKRPIQVIMVFGVERESRDTLDQGAARTAGDFLAMHNQNDPKQLASAARSLWQYQTFGLIKATHQAYAPTRSEIKQTALNHPGLVKSLAFVSRPGIKALGSASLLAFCHFAFKAASNDISANYFIDALIDGADLKRTDPILYVRNRLIADRRTLRLEHRVELLFRAWNAHRLGEERVLLRTYGGELPQLEA